MNPKKLLAYTIIIAGVSALGTAGVSGIGIAGVSALLRSASTSTPRSQVDERVYQIKPAVRTKTPPAEVSAVIREFRALEPVYAIAEDAQQLKEERKASGPGGHLEQIAESKNAHWNRYDLLLAQANTNDARSFRKEYELHRLRTDDYLFRQSMCEDDFQSAVKDAGSQTAIGWRAAQTNSERNGAAQTAAAELMKLQKIERQTSKGVKSLKEVEQGLRGSMSGLL